MADNESELNNIESNNPPEQSIHEDRLSRLSGSAPSQAGDDDIVREYERRYRPETREKPKAKPRSYSTMRVSNDDKLWAAVVHSSVWLTFLMAVPTSGISIPFVIFIPLIVYFMFRNRSDFVAFHALQAFVLQLICTVGAMAVVIIGGLFWTLILVVLALLSALLVGIPLFILWVLVGVVASVLLSVLPLAGLALATIAAFRVYFGGDYRYPYIANWVDRQMAGGFLNA